MTRIRPETWQLRWRLREFASTRPVMWRLSNWARGNRHGEINRRTDLLIDGFPRSANSRIEAYVSLLYPSLRLAHHRHVSAQFRLATAWNKPAILLIRQPSEAIASLLFRNNSPEMAAHAIESWITLNRDVAALSGDILICSFATSIGNPARIAGELHRRFGRTSEVAPGDAQIRDERIDAEIQRIAEKRNRTSKLNYGGHFSVDFWEQRKNSIDAIRADLEDQHGDRLKIAMELYQMLEERAV